MTRRPGWHVRGLLTTGFAHGVSDFYSGMVPLLVFTVVTAHRLSPVYQGAIGFLWYLTSSIVQPLFGAYSDRAGRWWFLPASVALTAFAVSLMGLSGGVVILGALVAIGGLGSAVMHPEAGKYAAMLSGDRKSGGISIFQIGGAAGYAAGPAAVAMVISRYGLAGSLWMLLPGVAAVGALFAVMHGIDAHARRSNEHGVAQEARAPIDTPGIAILVAGTALRYLTGAAFMTYLPNVLVGHGWTLAQAGLVVTAFLASAAIGLYAGGWLGDRFGPVPISVASLSLAAPALFAYSVLGSAAALPLLMLGNILLNVQSAPSVAIVQRMLPRNLALALGLMNGVAFGAGSALVTLVGLGVARAGASPTLIWVSGLPLLSAAAFFIGGRRAVSGGYASARSSAIAS